MKPVAADGFVKTVSNDVVDAIDTTQDRSSTYCDTPLVAWLESKLLAFRCNEHASDQISIATQLNIDKHKSMQSATDESG